MSSRGKVVKFEVGQTGDDAFKKIASLADDSDYYYAISRAMVRAVTTGVLEQRRSAMQGKWKPLSPAYIRKKRGDKKAWYGLSGAINDVINCPPTDAYPSGWRARYNRRYITVFPAKFGGKIYSYSVAQRVLGSLEFGSGKQATGYKHGDYVKSKREEVGGKSKKLSSYQVRKARKAYGSLDAYKKATGAKITDAPARGWRSGRPGRSLFTWWDPASVQNVQGFVVKSLTVYLNK